MPYPEQWRRDFIWGVMAIGVYLTFRILDIADLTVDGSLGTGGAVCIMMMLTGHNVWISMACAFLAGMMVGLVTGIFNTFMGIPAILAGILTQLGLYSINLKVMGKANQAINVDKYQLLVSLRFIRGVAFYRNTILLWLWRFFFLLCCCTGSSEQSLDALCVRPDAMKRWHGRRESTPTLRESSV